MTPSHGTPDDVDIVRASKLRHGSEKTATACTTSPSPAGHPVHAKHWDVMRSDDAGGNWREISIAGIEPLIILGAMAGG